MQNLAGSGWIAKHAFATGQQLWGAKCILVAPTAFRTAMPKMQEANQLPMPAGGADSASANAPVPVLVPVPVPPPVPVPQPELVGSEFQQGDLFSVKTNTNMQPFGTFWKEAGTPDGIYMIPNSTEVTVLANVQLEFFGYCGESVKMKPTLGFQQTINKI